jgi:hypothetical protein
MNNEFISIKIPIKDKWSFTHALGGLEYIEILMTINEEAFFF